MKNIPWKSVCQAICYLQTFVYLLCQHHGQYQAYARSHNAAENDFCCVKKCVPILIHVPATANVEVVQEGTQHLIL